VIPPDSAKRGEEGREKEAKEEMGGREGRGGLCVCKFSLKYPATSAPLPFHAPLKSRPLKYS